MVEVEMFVMFVIVHVLQEKINLDGEGEEGGGRFRNDMADFQTSPTIQSGHLISEYF